MTVPELGVFLPSMSGRRGSPGDMAATARHAEALGLESVWVVDQLIAGRGVPVLDRVWRWRPPPPPPAASASVTA